MEVIYSLLENAVNEQANIFMFYTIIVTTVFGVAFTDQYRKLTVLPRIILTLAVGAAVWYNFLALEGNTQLIFDIREVIEQRAEPGTPAHQLFVDNGLEYLNIFNPPKIEITRYLYMFVNIAVLIAMWWDLVRRVGRWFRR